jgi:RimJ/RimL family protein N-acetyltransferase
MITAQRIELLPLAARHLDCTRNWANEPELMRLLNRTDYVSEATHNDWFASIQNRTDCVYFAIETRDSHQHIGNIWLWDIDQRHRRAEVRVMIGEKTLLGRGFGTEAIALIADYGFRQLHLHKMYAYVLSINPRARSAFEKAGFAVEGVLRQDRWTGDQFTDVFFLGKLNDQYA